MFPATSWQWLHNKCSSIISSWSDQHLEPNASSERAAQRPEAPSSPGIASDWQTFAFGEADGDAIRPAGAQVESLGGAP